jgi:hypothetical protein
MFGKGLEGLNRSDPIKKHVAITVNRLCLLACITAVIVGVTLIVLKVL